MPPLKLDPLWRALLCAHVILYGCSSQTDAPLGDAGIDAASDGAFLWGNIELQMQEAQLPSVGMRAARGIVSGKIYDGPIPNAVPLRVAMQIGTCQLLKPMLPLCTPACAQDRVCVAGNVCQAYPKAKDVGELMVLGLTVPVVLPPVPPSFAYQSSDLPYPPCEDGVQVSLMLMNAVVVNRCFSPLTIDRNAVPVVRRGEPLRLVWNAPALPPQGSRIEINLDVAHHGGSKTGEILCDVADTGSFEVPAPLIDALINLGLAGAPSVMVSRVAAAPLASHPNVRFVVSARVERPVDTGVVTCFGNDAACPPEHVCDRQRLICVGTR